MKLSGRRATGLLSSLFLAMHLAIGPLAYQNAALACGPFFDSTVFSCTMHPDLPLSLYAKGNLGVAQPTYARSYQIVAYRYLSGKPLAEGEQSEFLDYWHSRLNGSGVGMSPDDPRASENWLKDRAKFLGVKDKTPVYSDVFRNAGGDGWQTYLNCPTDAFKTASATLTKLVSKYGADSPICKEWLKGQDAVFCHCQSPGFDYKTNKSKPEPAFPEKLPDSASLEARQDRQYQMAAAYFYAQKLDDALNLFTAISQDKASPWQTIGQYMMARTLVRKGTLSKAKGFDTDSLSKALVLLKQLATNSGYASFKKSIEDLVDFAQIRLDPAKSCQTLGNSLASPPTAQAPVAGLSRRIDNYVFAMDNLFNPDADPYGDAPDRKLKVADSKAASTMREDELTDWIWCFTSTDKGEVAHAADRFKSHHSLPWAVAYASKISGAEPGAAEVINALAKVGKNDPAFVSASYYRARLLLGGKQVKDGRDVIAAALANPNLPPSAANQLSLLALDHADSLEQFYSLSFRAPAMTVSGYDSQELPDKFDQIEKKTSFEKNPLVLVPESAQTINASFPLADFVAAVSSKNVARDYVKQFAQAAFTRAMMLGDYASALKMTPILKQSYPSVAKQISDFESATSPGDKEFAAAFLMLKCPGIRPTVTGGTGRGTAFDKIDDYQDNWWSKDTLTGSGDRGGGQQEATPAVVVVATPFMSATDKAAGKSQLAKLQAIGEAPNYMGKIVVAYAKAHPTDPRLPEALALTVKATHFGSADESKTTAVSAQAFQILHKSYPGNQWTKKTPYHY